MASVRSRTLADGTIKWQVQFRVDGKLTGETFDHPEGAYQFGDMVDKVGGRAARAALAARQGRTEKVTTLQEFTDRYLDPDSGLLTGISDGTREGYRRIAERSFLTLLGQYPIDAVGKAEVGKWVTWQENQPSAARPGMKVSPKTIRNYHALLSAVLAAAVQEGLRADNPAHKTRLSKGRKEESVFLTPEEFTTLLHFIPQRHQAFVLFLAGTGCRWGEATAVTWGDLNLRANPPTVRIDKAWKKGPTGAPVLGHPKSQRSNRTVSLSADVVAALGKPGKPGELVFPGQTGSHLWYGRFRTTTWVPSVERAQDPELCEAEGLEPLSKTPTVHDLRHSHASWLIARGVPLPLIQVRLGHESIQTTVNVYGHLQPDAHLQMADVVADTLSGVRPLRRIAS